jgi:hypothetical protein
MPGRKLFVLFSDARLLDAQNIQNKGIADKLFNLKEVVVKVVATFLFN